ncbi:MAG: hypothetical protein CVU05_04370 [Bacteroidetes bacterium HGW-Bacteroidetes-21]|jgi:type IX secretion system PorP/SprF family membrane protein|nr:MAG: hypothetical protein CVU05_04370 [Bacteroidetes bacterium HGW-Bacteroidetes-21]
MKKLIIIAIVLLTGLSTSFSQQMTSFTQYYEDHYQINPGAVGTLSYSPLSFGYRRLWTGMDDAPAMQFISSHVLVADNMGMGGKIFNYSTGAISKTGIEGTYSYIMRINDKIKLSLGLSLELYQFHLDKSRLTMEDMDDNLLLFGSEKLITPDASFGAYMYANNFYAGLAAYQLFDRKVDLMSDGVFQNKQVRHYFITGGYTYDINGNWSVQPSALIKVVESGIFQADINAKVTYRQTVSLGISYRTQDAAAICIGFQKERIFFGYAYDMILTDIKKYSLGSHELMFAFKFNRSKPKL